MSTLKVDTILKRTGTGTITLGQSGDTIALGSGASQTLAANTPAFHAYISSNQSVSSATDTKGQFDTESFDTDNAYDNSTNYRFTPQTSGKYFIYTQIRLDSGANNNNIDYCFVEILKNGSPVTSTILDFRDDRDGRKFTVCSSIILDMNGSTDYVEARGNISANVTTDLRFTGNSDGSLSYFGGYKLLT